MKLRNLLPYFVFLVSFQTFCFDAVQHLEKIEFQKSKLRKLISSIPEGKKFYAKIRQLKQKARHREEKIGLKRLINQSQVPIEKYSRLKDSKNKCDREQAEIAIAEAERFEKLIQAKIQQDIVLKKIHTELEAITNDQKFKRSFMPIKDKIWELLREIEELYGWNSTNPVQCEYYLIPKFVQQRVEFLRFEGDIISQLIA